MKDILRRQQRKEAWDTTMCDPEWTGRMRALHERLVREPSLGVLEETLLWLRSGPTLGVLWTGLARRLSQLRSFPTPEGTALLEEMRELLSPPAEFVAGWQRKTARSHAVPLRQVDEHLWRSPQPTLGQLEELRGQGLRAVANLRQESEHSGTYCRELSLAYLHLPVLDQDVPRLEQVRQFLAHFQNGPTPVLVHCFAGQGRTGLFVACYRLMRGVPLEEAMQATDQETGSRGMREHQRAWVRAHAQALTGGGGENGNFPAQPEECLHA